MLSDDSSSDSETGRFKSRTVNQDEKSSNNKQERFSNRPGRSRNENDRFRREYDRRRDERERFDKHSRERPRYSRHSPVHRRRFSRERSPNRKSDEKPRHGDSRSRSKPRDHRSDSRDRYRNARTQQDSPERRKEVKDEIVKHIQPSERSQDRQINKYKENASSSPDYKGNRSEVYKPPVAMKRKSKSPIIVDDQSDNAASDDVQPGSYYSMIPAVVKDKSEESSEIDSSDDERLRAKLLNLEKELHKTKKKKHKKKHKRKSSKSSRDRDDASSAVEVSSTTDIQEPDKVDGVIISLDAAPEVTSTQKNTQKDSSEEGEISSDESQDNIDPTDLRHKLRRSGTKQDSGNKQSNKDVCGPALPPHLEKRAHRSVSPGTEGPALPPHLQKTSKNIGPTIPDDMRKVLAENDCEVIEESSDEGIGPLPAGAEDKWSAAHHKLEERALDMKIKQLDGHSLQNHKIKSREQWMLELPEGKAKILGLEARSFRAKEGPDMSDRSSWTDTPEDKALKAAGIQKEEDVDAALLRDVRARHIANRDDEQELAIKKHKKKHKREESLLDLHQKKLKKKKKKDSKDEDKKERRPFSRDVDLQVNRFDEAQKNSIIKKAQDLNTRFSSGEAKFL